MRYLLDTHVLLWLLGQSERVPETIRVELGDPSNELLVSSISALEVATKERLGKLAPSGLTDAWANRVADIGARELAVAGDHAIRAGVMRWDNRDPFDRILVAQATIEAMTLVTVDDQMRDLPAPAVMTW